MKLFIVGIDQLIVNQLKQHEFEIIIQAQLPDPAVVGSEILILHSDYASITDLEEVRDQYSDAKIFYQYDSKGLSNIQSVHALCVTLNIYFLSHRATYQTFLSKLKLLSQENESSTGNLIGFFGSGPGIGTTRLAATYASYLAAENKKVVMLGLNLYDPGWDYSPKTSLDLWRTRLAARVLNSDHFKELPQVDGFSYLPGNFDYLAVEDYHEEEIEYLIAEAKKYADVVVADFGAIPMSAAWYVGIQMSNVKYLNIIAEHRHRLTKMFELTEHLNVYDGDFLLVVNHADQQATSARSVAQEINVPLVLEIPYLGKTNDITYPLGRREVSAIKNNVSGIVASIKQQKDEES